MSCILAISKAKSNDDPSGDNGVSNEGEAMTVSEKITKTDQEWREQLDDETFRVTRKAADRAAFLASGLSCR